MTTKGEKMVMRKTKIVCTLGPATNNEEKIRQLMLNGMDVARMNFSHGDHASHLATLNMSSRAATGRFSSSLTFLIIFSVARWDA